MLGSYENRLSNKAQNELACLSFLNKFYNSGYDTEIELKVCALEEALYSLYLKENKEKILILYLHNQESNFSTEFCRILSHGEEKDLLESNFIVHGLDVGENLYLDDLMETFENFYQLSPCVDLVRKKQAALFFIAIVDMDIQICNVLRDTQSLQNIYLTMQLLVDSIFTENSSETGEVQRKDETQTDNECGYRDFQQKMYDWMANRDYDQFEANELNELKDKISFALFGVPIEESGYSEKQKEEAEKMYDIILKTNNEFSQYENQVKIAILYNCLIPLDSTSNQQFSPVPIFILRKCAMSENPCRIVIDHTRRVYMSWNSYLEDNKFCECLMVVPQDGRYEEDENGKIKLVTLHSPSCKVANKVLKATDITSTVLGLGSTGVMVAAAVPAIAIAPAAVIAAAAVGAGVGVYSIGRSISTLVDRGLHRESLNVTEAESRAAYLNIAAGVVGFAGAGANAAVSQLAANGATVGTSARIAVNTLGVANIGISGLAVSNSVVEIFMRWWIDDETPSALTVLQLSTSILFFGHAVYNFQSAGTIIEESQVNTLQKMKDNLGSNKMKKMFRKLELETIRQNGGNTQQGRAEVIKAISRLKNKNDVFKFLSRNNKKFNEMGVKFAASNGQIKFNGIVLDLVEISSMSWKDVSGYFSDLPKSSKDVSVPVSDNTRINFNLDAVLTIDKVIPFLKLVIGPLSLQDKLFTILQEVLNYLKFDQAHFKLIEILDEIFPNGRIYIQTLKMILSFVQKKTEDLQRKVDSGDSSDCFKYFKDLDDVQKKLALIQQVCDTILLALHNNTAYMDDLLRFSVDWVMNAYIEFTEQNERQATTQQGAEKSTIVICKDCKGHYFK